MIPGLSPILSKEIKGGGSGSTRAPENWLKQQSEVIRGSRSLGTLMRIRTAAPFMRLPMKQSRKGESKERQVDILMYGWAIKA